LLKITEKQQKIRGMVGDENVPKNHIIIHLSQGAGFSGLLISLDFFGVLPAPFLDKKRPDTGRRSAPGPVTTAGGKQ